MNKRLRSRAKSTVLRPKTLPRPPIICASERPIPPNPPVQIRLAGPSAYAGAAGFSVAEPVYQRAQFDGAAVFVELGMCQRGAVGLGGAGADRHAAPAHRGAGVAGGGVCERGAGAAAVFRHQPRLGALGQPAGAGAGVWQFAPAQPVCHPVQHGPGRVVVVGAAGGAGAKPLAGAGHGGGGGAAGHGCCRVAFAHGVVAVGAALAAGGVVGAGAARGAGAAGAGALDFCGGAAGLWGGGAGVAGLGGH